MLKAGRSKPTQPTLGRFLNRDPIGFAGGLNLFNYPLNPVTFVDPRGLEGETATLTVSARFRGHGHAWLELYDPNATGDKTVVMGTFPHGMSYEPIHPNGLTTDNRGQNVPSENRGTVDWSRTYELSPEQLAAFKEFVENNMGRGWGPYNNCTDFAVEGLQAAGIDARLDAALWFGVSVPENLMRGIALQESKKILSESPKPPIFRRFGRIPGP